MRDQQRQTLGSLRVSRARHADDAARFKFSFWRPDGRNHRGFRDDPLVPGNQEAAALAGAKHKLSAFQTDNVTLDGKLAESVSQALCDFHDESTEDPFEKRLAGLVRSDAIVQTVFAPGRHAGYS